MSIFSSARSPCERARSVRRDARDAGTLSAMIPRGRRVVALCMAFALGSVAGIALAAARADDGVPAAPASQGYTLTLQSRTARQRVDAALADVRDRRFVQVEVSDVRNPDRIPLSFA